MGNCFSVGLGQGFNAVRPNHECGGVYAFVAVAEEGCSSRQPKKKIKSNKRKG